MTDPKPPTKPITLLFHDGELVDVRALLGELGTSFVERRGVLRSEDMSRGFALVIATPQRMLSIELPPGQPRPKQIAICDSDSRGLRNSLQRAGIQLMVRRPVHPTALRALVLHSLYRGPEKRRSVRVSIGAPVRVRAGWRQRPAILADLSMGGFRLLTAQPIEAGKSITLQIPAEVAAEKAYALKARVLRGDPGGDETTVTAKFEKLRPKEIDRLKRTIKAHLAGPAQYEQAERLMAAEAADESAPAEAPPEAAEAAGGECQGERRSDPRHFIDRRVIALGEQASRVLMGRDISAGGMRVNSSPLLVVGENIRLAIHAGEQGVPLVVTARVHRNDGDRGMVLRFHGLEPDATHALNQILDSLPVIEPGSRNEAGMIVSEILAEAG